MAEIYGRVSGRDAGRYRRSVSPGARRLPSLHGLLLGRRAEVPEDHGEPWTRGIDEIGIIQNTIYRLTVHYTQ